MTAGHTEIFRALMDLCKPNPAPAVAGAGNDVFEEVRNRMIDLYGAAVDHPDFHHCYRLCLDVGGRDSIHLQNLYDFTQLFVNPKVRNLRFEAYAMVAPLPWGLPRFKIAVIKWTWKQPPVRGWCPVPPNLGNRVNPSSPTSLREAVDDMEHAMTILTMDVAPVVDKEVGKGSTVRWLAEVDIGLVQKLLCVPRNPEDGQTKGDQLRVLRKECGEFLAVKISNISPTAVTAFNNHYDPSSWNQAGKMNEILRRTHEVVNDRVVLERVKEEQKEKPAKAKSAVADPGLDVLIPHAAQLDDRGRVHYPPTEYVKPAVLAMTVELRTWWHLIDEEHKLDALKAAFRTACWNCQQQHRLLLQKIAIIRKGSEHFVKTTGAIAAKQLIIPLFFRKLSSVCTRDEAKANHYAVDALITRSTTELEQLTGIEQQQETCDLVVMPECKVPHAEQGKEPKPSKGDNMHPFWAINRRQKRDEVCNCKLGVKEITVVHSAPAGPDDAPEHGSTMRAHIPFIYNDVDLPEGAKLVLTWDLKPETQKPKSVRTWHTDFEAKEHKRAKLAGASGGG